MILPATPSHTLIYGTRVTSNPADIASVRAAYGTIEGTVESHRATGDYLALNGKDCIALLQGEDPNAPWMPSEARSVDITTTPQSRLFLLQRPKDSIDGSVRVALELKITPKEATVIANPEGNVPKTLYLYDTKLSEAPIAAIPFLKQWEQQGGEKRNLAYAEWIADVFYDRFSTPSKNKFLLL